MSIHIAAKEGDIAETVLLPGDPLRAEWIAKWYLTDVNRYSTVRSMSGLTGTTRDGKRVSVQGSGMGMPSLSIYVTELIKNYGVKRIIRVGTAGSLHRTLPLRSIVLAQGGCSDSALNHRRFAGMSFAPIADWETLLLAYETARKLGIPVHVGNVFGTDDFYGEYKSDAWRMFAKAGVMAVEMETPELYTLAAFLGVKALSILTLSDDLETRESLSSEDREKGLTDMVTIALELI